MSGRVEIRLRLSPEDRARAAALAERLGTKPMALIFLVLAGELAEIEGRLDDDGRAKLAALSKALGAAKIDLPARPSLADQTRALTERAERRQADAVRHEQ